MIRVLRVGKLGLCEIDETLGVDYEFYKLNLNERLCMEQNNFDINCK